MIKETEGGMRQKEGERRGKSWTEVGSVKEGNDEGR